MKLASLSFSLAILASFVSGTKFTVKKVKPSQATLERRSAYRSASDFQVSVDQVDAEGSFDLSTYHDLIYIANITVGGVEYPVQLDTGSSDLFIKGESSPIPGTKPTDQTFNLTYAIGWAQGNIGYAPVEFLENKVPSQAFLDATEVKNPALSYGAVGIAGLGFNKLSSLDMAINKTNSPAGRSLLYNLFAANQSTPNFIAFALQRGSEPGDDVEGSFSIGEVEPQFKDVIGSNRIPTWPIHDPFRWNVLIDAVIVNSSIIVPSTRVEEAPSNKAVALMDSGSSYTYAPKGVVDAIYANVPGARFDAKNGYWIVPCTIEINMAFQIAGEIFPVHPLDVNPTFPLDPQSCIGSFIPQTFAIGNDFDWIVGDNFLRAVYSMYDFGDFDSEGKMGDPYMKMLSITDADEASEEFHKLRGGTPRTNITFTGLDGASIAPSFSISNDITESLQLIAKFIPIMLGVIALNALIVIICVIVWMVSYIRKNKRNRMMQRQARTPRGRMTPMPMNPRNSYIAGEPPSSPIPHVYEPVSANTMDDRRSSYMTAQSPMGTPVPAPQVYEPVSMALTEDTFVPPSPAFHRFEKSKLNLGDRPMSASNFDEHDKFDQTHRPMSMA
jgi:saccharopepsin